MELWSPHNWPYKWVTAGVLRLYAPLTFAAPGDLSECWGRDRPTSGGFWTFFPTKNVAGQSGETRRLEGTPRRNPQVSPRLHMTRLVNYLYSRCFSKFNLVGLLFRTFHEQESLSCWRFLGLRTQHEPPLNHCDTHTVDGRNPASVDRWFIPLFTGICTSQVVVWDFWAINSSIDFCCFSWCFFLQILSTMGFITSNIQHLLRGICLEPWKFHPPKKQYHRLPGNHRNPDVGYFFGDEIPTQFMWGYCNNTVLRGSL